MLQWILRIIVIALVLGSGIGLSSEKQQGEVDVDPIPEENQRETPTNPAQTRYPLHYPQEKPDSALGLP